MQLLLLLLYVFLCLESYLAPVGTSQGYSLFSQMISRGKDDLGGRILFNSVIITHLGIRTTSANLHS